MRTTVNILFMVGIFVNLLKAGDLILRQHQQKWIQDKLESATLWLEVTKPIQWYTQSTVWKRELLLISLSVVVYLVLLIAASPPIGKWWYLLFALSLFLYLGYFLHRTRLGFRPRRPVGGRERTSLFVRQTSDAIRKWLLGGHSFPDHFWRPFVVVIGATVWHLAYFASWKGVSYLLEQRKSGLVLWQSFVFGLLYTLWYGVLLPFMADFGVLGVLACLILLGSLTIIVLEGVLKMSRAIAWRIVEYNKGATAAIILIITLILGFFEIYLRFK